jgi:ComF family protein
MDEPAAAPLPPVTRLVRGIVAAARLVTDYALPPRCPGCGVIVAADREFCFGCWQSLDLLAGPACAGCSIPVASLVPDPELRCGACLADPPPFDGAPAALAYGPVARTVALRLKYGRRLGHARLMAQMMARPLAALGRASEAPPLLVPVPLHRWRLWSRGFNQSGLIARHLATLSDSDFADDLLLRVRATPSLRGLGGKARAKAVQGAFAITADARARLQGRHIVLVDDVHASGATLRACARILARTGAARVSALTFARVVPDTPDAAAFDFGVIDSDMGVVKGM